MKPTVAGLLFLSLIGIIYFTGCSSERDLAEYYHDLDDTAYLKTIDDNHFAVRLRLLESLSEYLKTKASGDRNDSLYRELDWLIGLYYGATGIRDLPYQLSTYAAWDTAQAREIISLRESQARLLRSRDSLSLPAIRGQLEKLGRSFGVLNDSLYVAVISKDIAQVFESHDQIDSAICYYRTCISDCRNLDYYSLIGNCEMLLGRIYNYRLADYMQSEMAYSDAIRSFRKIDDNRFIPYVQLGRVYDFLQLYQTETAIGLINDVLPELKNREDRSNEAYCYYFLSVAYNNLGLLDSALYFGKESAVLRQRLASVNSTGLSDLGYSLSQLGLIYCNYEDDKRALELYYSADSIFDIADDSAGTAVNLIAWGNHYNEEKAYDSARAKFDRISGGNNSYENFVSSRYGLAICEYYQGHIDRAITELKNCIWLVEHANRKLPIPELKTGILSDKIGFYNLLSAIYVSLFDSTGNEAYADSAFFFLERSKSRALVDNLSRDTRRASDTVENRYLRRLAEIHKTGRKSGDSDIIEKAIHDIEDSLLLLYVEESEHLNDNIKSFADKTVDLTTIRDTLLDGKTVLLEYLLSHDGSFIFIISKGNYKIRAIEADFDSLRVMINRYLEAIDSYPGSNSHQDDYIETGKKLYALLIPDKELAASEAERIIVVASGALHYLPMESLIDEKDRFLVEQFDVSYVPSATTLRLISPDEIIPKEPAIVAFASSPASTSNDDAFAAVRDSSPGQPYWSVDHLAPLPSCSVEVRTIIDCFGPEKVERFIGEDATETNFKDVDFKKFDYLHIAAHGLTDERHPDRSAIILSATQDDENDGFLRPREIIQLEIPAKLVFLSSCRSGRGKSFPGEGVLNLARPFLIAGCRSAVVTYWNIGDIATAEFTGYFYQQLISGQSHSRSLAMAKRQFIRSHRGQLRHPYFWAPFVLIGS